MASTLLSPRASFALNDVPLDLHDDDEVEPTYSNNNNMSGQPPQPPSPRNSLTDDSTVRGVLGLSDKKKLKFRECFPDQTSQTELLGVNACHYDNVPGTLFCTRLAVFFSGKIFARKLEIDFVNIKAICKRKYGLIPNAVSVVAQDGKYKFYDLRNRDAVYELLQAAWRAVVPNADALQKQYDMGENGTMPSLHEDANDNLRADMPLEPVSDVEEDSESLLSNTSSSTPPNERVTRPPMSDKPKAQTPPLTISISAGRDSPVENEAALRHRTSKHRRASLDGAVSPARKEDSNGTALKAPSHKLRSARKSEEFDSPLVTAPKTPKGQTPSVAKKTNQVEVLSSQASIDIALGGEMKSGMVVFNEVLTGSVETVAGVLFDSVKFFQAVHMRRGDKEIKVGPWNDNTREVSFIMPVKIPMSNKTSTPVSETHQITRRDEQVVVMDQFTKTPEVPFGDMFISCCRYVVTPASQTQSRIVVSGFLKFVKSTMFKGKIESNAFDGMKTFYHDFYREEALKFVREESGEPSTPASAKSASTSGGVAEAAHAEAKKATAVALVAEPTSVSVAQPPPSESFLTANSVFGIPLSVILLIQGVLILLLVVYILWPSGAAHHQQPTALSMAVLEEYAVLRRNVDLEQKLLEKTYLKGVNVADMAHQLNELQQAVALLTQQLKEKA